MNLSPLLFADDRRLTADEAMSLCEIETITPLLEAAARRRDVGHGQLVSYSRKVFIPLTQACRDVCHYCTFAHPPRADQNVFMSPEEVLAVSRAGKAAGCKEALFTLGDKPELRYRRARSELDALGYATTLDYLAAMAELVLKDTGLFPHLNPGVMTEAEISMLREYSLSQGIMLESASERLSLKGGAHYGSPDKQPAVRLQTIASAGKHQVPFTTGILIGIGETRAERVEALLALRDLQDSYGHIQEIIVQNFQPKADTRMADVQPPSIEDHCWTIAVARLLFDPAMNIQAPPNLSPNDLPQLIAAGINDWGGISPVTPDYVNPEAPWPQIEALSALTAQSGKVLTERLALYPGYVQDAKRWVDARMTTALARQVDADGWPRTDGWHPGLSTTVPEIIHRLAPGTAAVVSDGTRRILNKVERSEHLEEHEIEALFRVRGGEYVAVCAAADDLRRSVNGDTVSYVVTRNINYTNICAYKCAFCAFSKGKTAEALRGRPYDLDLAEIAQRAVEATRRGASEVCMQGGIHPSYTGQRYLDICAAVKSAVPDMHVHAFSPLEIWHGAQTLGVSIEQFLTDLRQAGLSSLPGTAAEILDDEIRAIICPDKVSTEQWLQVMRTAHGLGIRSTATIMFGHVDRYAHWARHLIRVRDLQMDTGGFTEFVPLPFVHMEAPIHLKGQSRSGPTYRETILMHAIARLVLHPHITNIQASWVKIGEGALQTLLDSGVNDLGGTLMDESISRAAGASHGQEMKPERLEALIRRAGRTPRQRTTFYGSPPSELRERSFDDSHTDVLVSI